MNRHAQGGFSVFGPPERTPAPSALPPAAGAAASILQDHNPWRVPAQPMSRLHDLAVNILVRGPWSAEFAGRTYVRLFIRGAPRRLLRSAPWRTP